MAIVCRLREYTAVEEPRQMSLARNLVLIAAIAAIAASLFLGVSFAIKGSQKSVEAKIGADHPVKAENVK